MAVRRDPPSLPPYGWLAGTAALAGLSIASLPLEKGASILAAALLGAAAAGLLAGARTPVVHRRAVLLSPFILFLAAMEFFRPDAHQAVMTLGLQLPLGPLRAGALLLKTYTVLALGLAWGERVGPHGIARTLHRFRAPAAVTATTFLATSFLTLMAREWQRVRLAASARGLAQARFPVRLRQVGGSAMSVLVRALWRGERLGQAMRARGYGGRLPPPTRRPGPPGARERLLVVITSLLVLLSLKARLP